MTAATNKFSLGQVLATPAALDALEKAGQKPSDVIARHASGDWGEELCEEDRRLNDEALRDGSRLLSAYLLTSGQKVWVITEAADDTGQRAATTILLPEEYQLYARAAAFSGAETFTSRLASLGATEANSEQWAGYSKDVPKQVGI